MEPMTKMEAEMKLRNFSPRTQREYLRVVRAFSAHFGKSPEQLGTEQVREYLLDVRDRRQLSPSTLKVYRAALRFFYENTQGRPEVVAPVGSPKVPHKLPQVLSGTEVEALFGAIRSLKYRALVMTTYAAGLRISEACQLEPRDIDSSRMLIHVRHGKGGGNRFLMLSQRLLEQARRALGQPSPSPASAASSRSLLPWRERQIETAGKDPLLCRICHRVLKLVGKIFGNHQANAEYFEAAGIPTKPYALAWQPDPG